MVRGKVRGLDIVSTWVEFGSTWERGQERKRERERRRRVYAKRWRNSRSVLGPQSDRSRVLGKALRVARTSRNIWRLGVQFRTRHHASTFDESKWKDSAKWNAYFFLSIHFSSSFSSSQSVKCKIFDWIYRNMFELDNSFSLQRLLAGRNILNAYLKINTYFLKGFVRLLFFLFLSSNLLLERSLQFRGFYHLFRDIFLNGLKLNETVQNAVSSFRMFSRF